jgi:hypothetical protein
MAKLNESRKVYQGQVEMGVDLTVIEIGDDIKVRRFK